MAAKTHLKSTLEILVFVLVVGAPVAAGGQIIYVDDDGPADFSSIRAAINEADDGDVVIVAEGRYFGNINFNGKNITLRSTEPNDQNVVAATIIDGRQAASVVIFERYEYTNCVLDGFTITNGRAKYGGGVRCFNGSPTLKNCVFVDNFAEDHGGGMFNYNSSPTLTNCTFTKNSAHGTSGGGGAIQNVSSNVMLTNCTFNENQVNEYGAAMYNDRSTLTLSNCIFSGHSGYGGAISNHSSDLILTDCIFTTNSTLTKGGAMINYTSSLTLTNCTFVGNSAKWGGAIHNHEGTLNITNSTFCANRATSRGGAINNYYHTNLKLINCILWANSANEGPQIALEKFSTISASYCDIQGGPTALYTSESFLQWGDGNIDTGPMFVRDPDPGLDGNWDGVDDDLGDFHLACGSPCLDAGTNTTEPPLPLTDLDGKPRIINAIVDMGPFEGHNQAFVIDGSPLIIPEGTAVAFTIALACDPGRSVTVSLDYEAGDEDIIVKSRKPLKFNSKNFSVPRTVTLIAAEDQDRVEGTTRFNLSAPGIPYSTVLASELENDVGPIVFVDAAATGRNDGSSWPNAFNELYDAITVAADAPHSVSQIHVAAGTYKPAEPGSDREATFHLINGLVIQGGYAGSAHVDPDARDIHTYETILSGDLNGDDASVSDPEDLLTEPTRDDNSYNVITGSGTDATAVIDGLTITAGNANGPWPKHSVGAGIYIAHAGPTLTNCTFRENYSTGSGGAILNYHGSPTLTNCNFTRNASKNGGAAIMNETGDPIIANCTFNGNWADNSGGAIKNWDNSPIIKNCTFTQNSAKESGGAIHNNYCQNPVYINCVFSGNSADSGGAIFTRGTNLWRFTICTFTTNSAQNGNALASDSYWSAHPSNVQFTNCILWDGANEIWNNDNSTITMAYSDIWGNWPGHGNIDADPRFAGPGYWDANGVWVDGDYHLLHGSPCIDAGDPNYIAEPNETDLEGNPRVINGRVDMGAYEYGQLVPAEARFTPRTINLASKGNWITCYIWLPEEYDVVDIEPNSILLECEIKLDSLHVDKQAQVATARFSREDIQAILAVGEVDLTITGQLADGTTFKATDIIKVTDKVGKN
jgi:predicted outer membrane repeat protein